MSFVAYTSFRSLGNNNYIQYMAICIFHSSYSIPSEISSIVPANKTLLHSQFNIFITTLQLLISTYSKQNPPTFSHDSWIMWGDETSTTLAFPPKHFQNYHWFFFWLKKNYHFQGRCNSKRELLLVRHYYYNMSIDIEWMVYYENG